MAMITNIRRVETKIIPGVEIETEVFYLKNYPLHLVCNALARTCIGAIENESNNMGGELVPRNVAQMNLGYATAIEHYADAIAFNDPVTPIHEKNYEIDFPTEEQILTMRSYKMQMCVKELKMLAECIVSSDAAGSNGNVANPSKARIDRAFADCTAKLEKWIGSGADNDNTGLDVPAYLHVGSLRPDIDGDGATIEEPSSRNPSGPRLDSPDVPRSNGD